MEAEQSKNKSPGENLSEFAQKFASTKHETSEAAGPKPVGPTFSDSEKSPTIPKLPLPKEQPARGSDLSKETPSKVEDKLNTTTKAEQPASDIRKAVIVAVSALRGETTNDRVRSVGALLNNLPMDLNAREIALIAGYETTSHREQILVLLVNRTKPRSLDPKDIPAILGTETTSNRVNCIRIIANYIKPPITGMQAATILGSETESHRVACLRLIAPLLQRPLSDSEVQSILSGTSTSDRTEAIKALFDYTKESEKGK
jgi:hypothetical protein